MFFVFEEMQKYIFLRPITTGINSFPAFFPQSQTNQKKEQVMPQ